MSPLLLRPHHHMGLYIKYRAAHESAMKKACAMRNILTVGQLRVDYRLVVSLGLLKGVLLDWSGI